MALVESYLRFKSIEKMSTRLLTRGKTQSTVETYCYCLSHFLRYMKADDPDALLEEFRAKNGEVPNTVNEYIDFERRSKSGKSVHLRVTAVKKWLSSNNVLVDWKAVEMPDREPVEVDRVPTREELRRIIGCLSVRNKAFTHIAISSGLRAGTALSLTWGEVESDFYEDVGRIVIRKAAGRKFTGGMRFYVTYFSAEAKSALADWRRQLERKGVEVKPEDRVFKTCIVAMEDSWHLALKKTGLDRKVHRVRELHLHVLRKFFRTQCEISGVPRSFWDYWMGHKGGYLDESYFRAIEAEHVKEYRKAVPYLCLAENPEAAEKIREIENAAKIERSALLSRLNDLERGKASDEAAWDARLNLLEKLVRESMKNEKK